MTFKGLRDRTGCLIWIWVFTQTLGLAHLSNPAGVTRDDRRAQTAKLSNDDGTITRLSFMT